MAYIVQQHISSLLLHPKHSKALRVPIPCRASPLSRARGPLARNESKPQTHDVARVRGTNNPVVPQAGSRVQRARLLLDLTL